MLTRSIRTARMTVELYIESISTKSKKSWEEARSGPSIWLLISMAMNL